MTSELLESLLYQNESETLDFKSAQYAFEKATDEQKGELLKDILAFANAWRQTDAYILIGVEERRRSKSIVVGVDHHLVNRNLQQFVTSRTNRPVFFSYSGLTFEESEVGVLEIPLQERPVFLNRDFGRLRANVVYIRRGDTTGEASPDEVLRMASTSGLVHRGQPTLDFEYGDPETRDRWGQTPSLLVVSISVPHASRLPDYGIVGDGGFYVPNLSLENPDFYRETANYLHEHLFMKAVSLAIDNTSTVLAENATVKIRIDALTATVRTRNEMPSEPSTDRYASQLIPRPIPTNTSVSRYADLYEVTINIGNVQPGTTVWAAEPFYIGSRKNATITGAVSISANNLRLPKTFETTFTIGVEERVASNSDVKSVAKSFE
jgi:hypothetical protein